MLSSPPPQKTPPPPNRASFFMEASLTLWLLEKRKIWSSNVRSFQVSHPLGRGSRDRLHVCAWESIVLWRGRHNSRRWRDCLWCLLLQTFLFQLFSCATSSSCPFLQSFCWFLIQARCMRCFLVVDLWFLGALSSSLAIVLLSRRITFRSLALFVSTWEVLSPSFAVSPFFNSSSVTRALESLYNVFHTGGD